jgi:hypothetical protein
MATTTNATAKPAKTPKTPVALSERIKAQLSQATLKAKVSPEELDMLAAHIGKLKSLLA